MISSNGKKNIHLLFNKQIPEFITIKSSRFQLVAVFINTFIEMVYKWMVTQLLISSCKKKFLFSWNFASFKLYILIFPSLETFARLFWFEKLGSCPRLGIKFCKFSPDAPVLLTGEALPNISSKLSISSSSSTILDSSSFIAPGQPTCRRLCCYFSMLAWDEV